MNIRKLHCVALEHLLEKEDFLICTFSRGVLHQRSIQDLREDRRWRVFQPLTGAKSR